MSVENSRIKLGRDLVTMTAALGELEGLSSLAAFAFEHTDYPFASVVSSGADQVPVLVAESLGHPLIETSVCVRNPVCIDARNRFVLVSGSNMSGKSTYLRAIGLNYALARAGAPVCGERLEISMFSLATSVRVLDSLRDGKSRFSAEVSLVRGIIDLAENRPVLFLFDELLSGTNSEDRRAGAAGVIGQLLAKGASGFLTTHDLALTELVQARPNVSRNVHFVDHIADEAMVFDYRLREGIVPHSNGSAILAKLGILWRAATPRVLFGCVVDFEAPDAFHRGDEDDDR
jgi:DNA mismatch repair ATPase MutS